jgi:hypothetical protein
MKHLFRIALMALAIGTVFTGCKKDELEIENEAKSNGNIAFGSTSMDLYSSYVWHNESDPDGTEFEGHQNTVWLNGKKTDYIAEGFVTIELYSTTNTITPGTYTFDDSSYPRPAFTFEFLMGNVASVGVLSEEGTLVVAKNGANYDFTYEGLNQDSTIINISYDGPADYIEWE